jgi:hypothetical protein
VATAAAGVSDAAGAAAAFVDFFVAGAAAATGVAGSDAAADFLGAILFTLGEETELDISNAVILSIVAPRLNHY